MAYINAPALNDIPMGGTFSNKSAHHSRFVPAAATVAGDKVRLMRMQAGTKLLDAVAFVEDAVATLTLSLGYEYVDTSLSASDDAAYFFSAKDVAAGGKFRADVNKAPIELVADAYLVATLGVVAFATTNKLDTIVDYDFTGA